MPRRRILSAVETRPNFVKITPIAQRPITVKLGTNTLLGHDPAQTGEIRALPAAP
jgi:hypothetical protein